MSLLTKYDLQRLFNESLDDCYPSVQVAGIDFLPSDVLRECDPVAYRCGFADWLDSMVANGVLFQSKDDEYYDDESDLKEESAQ